MIDFKALIGTVAAIGLCGGAWLWITGDLDPARLGALAGRDIQGETAQPDEGQPEQANRADGPAAAAEGSPGITASATEQKAILACLLAATYGAEKRAKIGQIEAMLASMPADGPSLSAEAKAERLKIEQLLPENRRERDASMELYLRGVAALAKLPAERIDPAFAAISGELQRAGLTRLIRYIAPINQQIGQARSGGIPADARERWFEELQNAAKS